MFQTCRTLKYCPLLIPQSHSSHCAHSRALQLSRAFSPYIVSGRGRDRKPNTTLNHVTAPSFHPMDVVEHPNHYSITAGVHGGSASFGRCACCYKDMLLGYFASRGRDSQHFSFLSTSLLVVQYVTKSEQLQTPCQTLLA
jgi:hypothetical protein